MNTAASRSVFTSYNLAGAVLFTAPYARHRITPVQRSAPAQPTQERQQKYRRQRPQSGQQQQSAGPRPAEPNVRRRRARAAETPNGVPQQQRARCVIGAPGARSLRAETQWCGHHKGQPRHLRNPAHATTIQGNHKRPPRVVYVLPPNYSTTGRQPYYNFMGMYSRWQQLHVVGTPYG